MTNILAGNTDPKQNNWWSQYKIMSGDTRRPATLKTGTSDQTQDLFALGYVAPPADPNAPAIVAGVWAGNSDNAPGHSVMSLEMAAPIWHAFMQEVTAETPVTDFQQPDGVTWATVDTKIPVDIDTVTNTLWTDGCPGIMETKGFLNLSQVDSNNPTFQKYDQRWITRAQLGVGVRGGPSNGATMYFYQLGFWTPYGAVSYTHLTLPTKRIV